MAQLSETAQISFNGSTNSTATFGLDLPNGPIGVQQIYLRTTADVYISFDTAASKTQSYLLSGSNTSDTMFELHGGSVLKVYALGSTGTGTLYIMGIRN